MITTRLQLLSAFFDIYVVVQLVKDIWTERGREEEVESNADKGEGSMVCGCSHSYFGCQLLILLPCVGSGAVSKWVICACDSLVDFGAV